MKYPKIPLAQSMIKLCKEKNIKHIVISPGSRNAPLTIGFTENDFFKCYSIVDERCAAFFAMGIAQQLREPVAVVCTSGSALLNYYPAISEAFYSDIPLVVISADRPSHAIDIGDGQTIRQPNVFENHILFSTNLKEDIRNVSDDQAIALQMKISDYNEAEINKAIDLAKIENGPVHINAPFEEPLYDMTEESNEAGCNEKIIDDISLYTAADLTEYKELWKASKRKMVLVGVNAPDSIEQRVIDQLASDPSVIVFTETTSNLNHDRFFSGIDKIIAPIEKSANKEELFKALQPDILLTFGGMVVSKKVKAFLRNYQPRHHWHIDKKKAYDTFYCLEKHFKTTVNRFLNNFLESNSNAVEGYRDQWLNVQDQRRERHAEYLSQIPFSDFKVFEHVLKSIPVNHQLQLSNSSTIRYTQLFELNHTLEVFCNRGTSGIDGSTSTAIGASVVSEKPTVLITGDLSFFYDSNALWNNYIKPSFRIIVINNNGGGIFRILPGHKNTHNFDTYFETKHQLNARPLAEMYNLDYVSANDEATLTTELTGFFETSQRPKILEVFTPREINDGILLKYFDFLKDINTSN